MPTLDKIKTRISSVKSTSKITKAMELVATAKIRRARENFDKTQSYYQILIDNVADIADKIEEKKTRYLSQEPGNTIWIILSSDLGLCGGYNSNNVKMLKEHYKKGDAILAIGLKAQSLLRTQNLNFEHGYSQIVNHFSTQDAIKVVDDALNLFNQNKGYSSIKLIASKFINNATFEPESINLIPILQENLQTSQREKETVKTITTFEQSPQKIIDSVVPMFLTYSLFAKVSEAKLIEQASRRIAMEAATKNANELLDDLKIQYNQQRQANITQEISEIIAGSNT